MPSTRKLDCHISPFVVFLLCTLTCTAEAPAVNANLLTLNTPRGAKTAFLASQWYDGHRLYFYKGDPAGLKYTITTQGHTKDRFGNLSVWKAFNNPLRFSQINVISNFRDMRILMPVVFGGIKM